MFVSKKQKIIILLFFCLISIVLFFIFFYDFSYKAKQVLYDETSITDLKSKLKKIENNNIDFTLNEDKTYYNQKEDLYYYYVDESNENKVINLKTIIRSDKKYNYMIIGNDYEFEKYYIDFKNKTNIIVYNDDEYFEISLQFTSVPILNINIDSKVTVEKQKATIELYGGFDENNKLNYYNLDSKIKYRGANSRDYPKKPYRITLIGDGEPLLNMRKDKNWNLEALYSDASKVRSKLAFDIWNDMNSVSPNVVDNDSESRFVDLYINQEYIGLYLLREPIDEKTLNFSNKTNESGILIKGITYVSFDSTKFDINKKTNIVQPFEMKYPKDVYDYSIYWDKIFDKIECYFFSKECVSSEEILKRFDITNFIDYKILMNVTMALDNVAIKNTYLSLQNENSKVIFSPWDLDQTFGLKWTGKLPTYLKKDLNNYNNKNYTNIFIKNENVKEINLLIKERYFYLRKNVLSIESINSKIDEYYNQIKYSAYKDSEKWIEANIETEISEVKQWYKNRIEFLDKYVGDYDV